MTRSERIRRGVAMGGCWLLAFSLLAATGCSVGEAVVDGFYGGIADAIAGVVSETLLGVAGLE